MHRHIILVIYILMAIFAKGQTMADEADRFLSAMPNNLQKKQEAAVREGIIRATCAHRCLPVSAPPT